MEYINIIIKIVFFYFFIILIYRIMGKREIGQLGIIDLIVSILIAEMVAISVEDPSKSILSSVIPIICLVILELILSYISLKSSKIRNVLDGIPVYIINNGKINYHEMIKQKYSLDDLLSQIRKKGYKSIEEISYAILENDGSLSIFSKKDKELPMAIILDGEIQYDVLEKMSKNEKFILNILDKKKIRLEEIFYAFYRNNDLYIIKYCEIK